MNNAIELKNLSFSYRKSEEILSIESLKIKNAEKLFLYGPSGSGKSTLLNIITGVVKAKNGQSIVLNEDLQLLSQSQRDLFRGNHIGFIFQNFNLIPYLTVYENIMLPLKTSKMKRDKITSIEKEIRRLASHLGIEDFLYKQVTNLSIGQQQRVAVARALIGDPEIVIADEPTSSLDKESTNMFMNLLLKEQEKKNFTLVFVSHDQNLSQYFDREISLPAINKMSEHA